MNIESATQNVAGVREVGAWFRKELEVLGPSRQRAAVLVARLLRAKR